MLQNALNVGVKLLHATNTIQYDARLSRVGSNNKDGLVECGMYVYT